ncbi:MAG: tyrosine-type recombinase/integrase [Halanaerobiales bacterium]
MEKVEPIRSAEKINQMKGELLKSGLRNYLLFQLGINTGFRVSDLLRLKVEDVRGKTHIKIKEKKTGKRKKAFINSRLKEDIDRFTHNLNDEEYLFQSQKGSNKPITRVQAYRVLRNAAETIRLENIGTHTLRKTFGYHHYKTHKDVALLQELFNHAAPSVTLKYIGINQDMMDQSLENFYL